MVLRLQVLATLMQPSCSFAVIITATDRYERRIGRHIFQLLFARLTTGTHVPSRVHPGALQRVNKELEG